MSLLNPGGQRAAPFSRIFGFENIHRAIQQRIADRDHRKGGLNSIAQRNRHTGLPHEHKREIARRRRQASSAA